jgi:hypothetical protein
MMFFAFTTGEHGDVWMNLFKKVMLFALILFGMVVFSTMAGAAKDPDTGASQEWAAIDGFRSARFGYKESDVLRAIKKDFRINKNGVSRVVKAKNIIHKFITTNLLLR